MSQDDAVPNPLSDAPEIKKRRLGRPLRTDPPVMSDAQIAEAKRLYEGDGLTRGLSLKEILERRPEYSVSMQTLLKKLRESGTAIRCKGTPRGKPTGPHKPHKHKMTSEQIARADELHTKGMPYTKIAWTLNRDKPSGPTVSGQTVRNELVALQKKREAAEESGVSTGTTDITAQSPRLARWKNGVSFMDELLGQPAKNALHHRAGRNCFSLELAIGA